MAPFDPTRPPAGRLARLGVVVDPTEPTAAAVARFADLAGIDVVWAASLGPDDAPLGDVRPVARRPVAGATRRDRAAGRDRRTE